VLPRNEETSRAEVGSNGAGENVEGAAEETVADELGELAEEDEDEEDLRPENASQIDMARDKAL
jgi:hypothetical protein